MMDIPGRASYIDNDKFNRQQAGLKKYAVE
jgi:hypothetical protein